uniref:Putative secreted protein n=1 Tax=Anopheles darlingi TaxID=43151 RepID=A0A2M4DIF2_ANODA
MHAQRLLLCMLLSSVGLGIRKRNFMEPGYGYERNPKRIVAETATGTTSNATKDELEVCVPLASEDAVVHLLLRWK